MLKSREFYLHMKVKRHTNDTQTYILAAIQVQQHCNLDTENQVQRGSNNLRWTPLKLDKRWKRELDTESSQKSNHHILNNEFSQVALRTASHCQFQTLVIAERRQRKKAENTLIWAQLFDLTLFICLQTKKVTWKFPMHVFNTLTALTQYRKTKVRCFCIHHVTHM